MKWPEKPTCHGDVGEMFASFLHEHAWRPPRAEDDEDWRTCNYCGSMHPEDLLRVLAMPDTKLGGADWKYGWPHKFYITIKNPNEAREVRIGTRADGTPIRGTRETFFAKWYNTHLLDEGYDATALEKLISMLAVRSGISFQVKDGKLMYRAPYHGYQK